MRIGELAELTGVSVRSLRYYEEHGLLHSQRTASAQRVYGLEAVERVRLLRRLYGAGLTSATIASLLPCVDAPSEAVTRQTLDLMRREHDRVSRQIDDLVSTRDDLTYLMDTAAAFLQEQQATSATPAGLAASA